MDVVRKSSRGGTPQFCGEDFSRVGAQTLFVGLAVFSGIGLEQFVCFGSQ